MTIELDGASLQEGVMDGLPLLEVWVGGEKIWPTREVVQITLGAGFQAQDQMDAALTARGLDYWNVTEIPFDIELVGSGSAQYLFNGFWALMSAPDMDTSQVTNMSGMFQSCSALTSVPDLDTSGVTNMNSMFMSCSALTHVPDMDTSQVTDMSWMFYDCPSLTDGNVRLIGRHPQVDTTGMITGSGLTREPFYDTAGNPI